MFWKEKDVFEFAYPVYKCFDKFYIVTEGAGVVVCPDTFYVGSFLHPTRSWMAKNA